MITNKPINEQFFRQNELVIEYQKLILTLPYMPAPPATAAAKPPMPPPPAKAVTPPPQQPPAKP